MVLAHNIDEGNRTQDVQISELVTFESMLLKPNTLGGLKTSGFNKPSPIQLHGIPLGKCGFDIFLEAKSGTGKTAVFTVIALEKLDIEKDMQAIILAPTREIAAQISDVVKQIGCSYENLNVATVIGGLSTEDDIDKFKKKVHIVVGSPGRLRHLIQSKHINVSAVRLFVLDEADKLMDKSFQADINYIFSVLPKEKQIIMSSATYPEELKSLMNKYVRNAQHISPDSTAILLGIKQLVTTVKFNSNVVRQTQHRFEEVVKILSKMQFKQCLIFCNYQVRVRELCKMLTREKWPAEQLHSQQEQTDRLDALKMLQEYKCRILVSTDLAARGIDASNVDLVINFEPPYEWQTYLHRIGRTGRFGLYGAAITILSEGKEEIKFKKMINSITGALELRNLWDEEKWEYNNNDVEKDTKRYNIEISTNTEIDDNDDDYVELLNKTMSANATPNRETKLMDQLLKPIPSKEIKIESFDELLKSFESFNTNHNVVSLEQSNKESSMCSASKTNVPNTHPNCSSVKEPEENFINGSKLTENNSINESFIKENCDKECNVKSVTRVSSSGVVDDVESDYQSEESQMHKALLDAGLPTSFGPSKRNKNKSNNVCYKKYKNNLSIQHKSQRAPQIDRKINASITELQINKENKRKSDFSYKQEYHFTHSKTDKEICHYQQTDKEKEYMMWYNNLKIHIEKIQMSLYIEELSKIS